MQTSSLSTTPRRWADPKATAAYIGSTVATLASWRCTKAVRLPVHFCGRLVRYDLNEVDAFLAADGQTEVLP